jgi:hypothetical protein
VPCRFREHVGEFAQVAQNARTIEEKVIHVGATSRSRQ